MSTRRIVEMLVACIAVTGVGAGCAPTPAHSDVVLCDRGSAVVEVTPGIRFESGPNDLALSAPTETVACYDYTGSGVTTARFDQLEVSFPSISCAGGPGVNGAGSAVISWSDGSTSQADLSIELDGMLSGTIDLVVTSGNFEGYRGEVELLASPAAGDCLLGITAEQVDLGWVFLVAT